MIAIRLLQLLLYFAVAVCLQYASLAFLDDFSGNSDEPSHYVTALLVRDYVAAGLPRDAMRFAEDFYVHYPKMALGHWPPAAYVMFAVWMLLFGASRVSALLMLAFLAAVSALLLFLAARRVLSAPASHLTAVALLTVPVVQMHYASVMLDVPLMLFSFATALAVIRLIERDRWADAVWGGALAGIAIMVKGNAWALLLVPPLALWLLRQPLRIFSARMVVAAVIVALTCAPFTIWSMPMVKDGWLDDSWNWRYTLTSFPQLGGLLFGSVGGVLAACALLGAATSVAVPLRHRRLQVFWAVMAAYVGGVWIFHALVPTSIEPRKMMQAVPALLLLAGAGLDRLAAALPARVPLHYRRPLVCAVAALAFAGGTFYIPRGYCPGFVRAATFLLSKPELTDVAFFVTSNTDGEGRLIAEVANGDARPQHVVIRSSKALVKTTWLFKQYQLRSKTPEHVHELLNRMSVAIVVLHNEPRRSAYTHHKLVMAMLNQSPDWKQIYTDRLYCSRHSKGEEITVYSYAPDPSRKLSFVEVDLENKIGRTLRR